MAWTRRTKRRPVEIVSIRQLGNDLHVRLSDGCSMITDRASLSDRTWALAHVHEMCGVGLRRPPRSQAAWLAFIEEEIKDQSERRQRGVFQSIVQAGQRLLRRLAGKTINERLSHSCSDCVHPNTFTNQGDQSDEADHA